MDPDGIPRAFQRLSTGLPRVELTDPQGLQGSPLILDDPAEGQELGAFTELMRQTGGQFRHSLAVVQAGLSLLDGDGASSIAESFALPFVFVFAPFFFL